MKIHNWFQFATVALGLLIVLSELAGWPGIVTLFMGGVSALTAIAAFFPGKRSEAALERQIGKLEVEQAGRTLSIEQRQLLITQLSRIGMPGEPIYLMGLQGNTESIRLANVLKQCFQDAGLAVDGVWEDSIYGGTGPAILVRQESQDGAAGLAISAALEMVGLETRIVALGSKSENKVEVIVAYKP